MKPILPSRPNHSWLRRRLRLAMRGTPSERARDYACCAAMVKWSGQFRGMLAVRARAHAEGPRAGGDPITVNNLDLKNRNAVITGGAAGIRLAIAQRLPASGARIMPWGRDDQALADNAKEPCRQTHYAR